MRNRLLYFGLCGAFIYAWYRPFHGPRQFPDGHWWIQAHPWGVFVLVAYMVFTTIQDVYEKKTAPGGTRHSQSEGVVMTESENANEQAAPAETTGPGNAEASAPLPGTAETGPAPESAEAPSA